MEATVQSPVDTLMALVIWCIILGGYGILIWWLFRKPKPYESILKNVGRTEPCFTTGKFKPIQCSEEHLSYTNVPSGFDPWWQYYQCGLGFGARSHRSISYIFFEIYAKGHIVYNACLTRYPFKLCQHCMLKSPTRWIAENSPTSRFIHCPALRENACLLWKDDLSLDDLKDYKNKLQDELARIRELLVAVERYSVILPYDEEDNMAAKKKGQKTKRITIKDLQEAVTKIEGTVCDLTQKIETIEHQVAVGTAKRLGKTHLQPIMWDRDQRVAIRDTIAHHLNKIAEPSRLSTTLEVFDSHCPLCSNFKHRTLNSGIGEKYYRECPRCPNAKIISILGIPYTDESAYEDKAPCGINRYYFTNIMNYHPNQDDIDLPNVIFENEIEEIYFRIMLWTDALTLTEDQLKLKYSAEEILNGWWLNGGVAQFIYESTRH